MTSGRRRAWGSLESDTMTLLWAATDPLTPGQVQQRLGGDLAYTTVQTILARLHDKHLIQRRQAGRSHIYWPTSDAATVAAEQMRAALDGPGDRHAVLRRFTGALSADDAELLRGLLSPPSDSPA